MKNPKRWGGPVTGHQFRYKDFNPQKEEKMIDVKDDQNSKKKANNKGSQFICCLGSDHKCMANVNDGYCADGTGTCQFKVRID